MKIFRENTGLPIKCWSENPEQGAIDQAFNLSKLPFAFKHIALMPDVHQGYGMPIGGVLATSRTIVPNAVGVDIGCGMCFVSTSLRVEDISKIKLKAIVETIKATVPIGFEHQLIKQSPSLAPAPLSNMPIVTKEYENGLFQLGTLGGGNHFIELQRTSTSPNSFNPVPPDSFLHIMIHSGSRNIGFKVANEYNTLATEFNERYFSKVPKQWGLAFLHMDDELGRRYYEEMNYCIDFAAANRKLMMEKVKLSILSVFPDTKFDTMIDVPHNFARLEHHYGSNVMVHRKGSTAARKDEVGIIPGSQGTSSFIVIGKGNDESFMSCSHGAGRKMGRREAQRVLDITKEKEILDSQNILHDLKETKDLDEASGAYKDIHTVIKEQIDLIDIALELKPLAVIKGS